MKHPDIGQERRSRWHKGEPQHETYRSHHHRACRSVIGASFVASIVAASLFVRPRLRMMERGDAVVPLVAPHMFFRTIGLGFLVPGVVSPSLSAAFAVPAAHGDFVAGILEVAATLALAKRASWAIVLVWVFNVWGAADLLNAIYLGNFHSKIDAGSLGAAFYIPTAIVPPLSGLLVMMARS